MSNIQWRDRIVTSPDPSKGDPYIKDAHIPVNIILGNLADGMTLEEIQEAHPQLSIEDIQATLAYAAEIANQKTL